MTKQIDPSIRDALSKIFEGVEDLKEAFKEQGRKFTVDGRLVGDIGEVIAATYYDVELDDTQGAGHDGKTSNGRLVQVKATFKNSLAFRTEPDYCRGFKLDRDGSFCEVFNGPGRLIFEHFGHLKDLGQKQKSFSISKLIELSAEVGAERRIPRR